MRDQLHHAIALARSSDLSDAASVLIIPAVFALLLCAVGLTA